jgi:hypothetical protein
MQTSIGNWEIMNLAPILHCNRPSSRSWLWVAFILMLMLATPYAKAADFNVTSPGFFFSTNAAGIDPDIRLTRGHTYTFSLSTTPGFHPFFIGTGVFSGVAPAGVSGANGGSSGTITYAVPANAPDCVYYCTVHGFSGNILMVDAPARTPPAVQILSFSLTNPMKLTTLQSTTNGFSFTPEISTNLSKTNWSSLIVQSNKFANGTNEIFCGAPPGTPTAFFRIRIDQVN